MMTRLEIQNLYIDGEKTTNREQYIVQIATSPYFLRSIRRSVPCVEKSLGVDLVKFIE